MQKCGNEYCMSGILVCKSCGKRTDENENKLVCNMCYITEQNNKENDDDDDSEDSLHNGTNERPNMKMAYSASRDPAKLGDTNETDNNFKVGNKEYEA